MFVCEQHVYGGIFPCPWPECDNGLPGGVIETDRYHLRRAAFGRRVGKPVYVWVFDELEASDRAAQLTRRAIAEMNGGAVIVGEGLFYHFTSAEGLIGILKSGELWLTAHGDLADKTEVAHGRDVAARTFAGLQHGCCPEVGAILAELAAIGLDEEVFVGCMSLFRESPVHWEEYANYSTGAALALEPLGLLPLVKADPFAVQISRVAYTWDAKARLFENLAVWFDEVARFDLNRGLFNSEKCRREMERVFRELLPLCKDVFFQREHESRILVSPRSSSTLRDLAIRTRASARGDIRYIGTRDVTPEFSLPVSKVWLGSAWAGDIEGLRSSHSFDFERVT